MNVDKAMGQRFAKPIRDPEEVHPRFMELRNAGVARPEALDVLEVQLRAERGFRDRYVDEGLGI